MYEDAMLLQVVSLSDVYVYVCTYVRMHACKIEVPVSKTSMYVCMYVDTKSARICGKPD